MITCRNYGDPDADADPGFAARLEVGLEDADAALKAGAH